MPTADEVADEVHGHGAGGGAVGDEAAGEDPEPGVAHRGGDDRAPLGVPGPRGAGGCRRRCRRAADGERVKGHGEQAVDGGEDEQRVAPAEVCLEQAGQGHEDGAGEPGHDRHRQQRRGASVRGEPGDDDGEGGFVEDHRARDPDAGHDGVELADGADLRPGHEQAGRGERTSGHERTSAVVVEPPADGDGREGAREDGGGERAGDGGGGDAEGGGHRGQQDRVGVVEDAVADGRGDGESGDDPPTLAWCPPTVRPAGTVVVAGISCRSSRQPDRQRVRCRG